MSAARYRLRSADNPNHGPICPVCAGPKATEARRCRSCWTETLRGESYWADRTCPDCGGPMKRKSAAFAGHPQLRCRPCTNVLMRGVPRSTPVEPSPDHIWRRRRFGKTVLSTRGDT